MKLSTLDTGFFKLDGGAMFGVVPKSMWNRINPADENNMCTWAMRCLLIETNTRKIVVDTGIGDKQDAKFRSHFEPHGEANLLHSLKEKGLQAEDITDVFLTHLHFDHCGGALTKNEKGDIVPAFPNAIYWSNQTHFDWAMTPNPREKASFLKENFLPLQEAGKIKFIEHREGIEWLPGINIRFVNGHTEAMMMLQINTGKQTVIYCADLIPSSGHVGLPYVMSYDLRPLVTMEEKKQLLSEAVANDYVLFFEHDRTVECATVLQNERGKFKLNKQFDLASLSKTL